MWRRKCSLCQVAHWVAGKMFIVPCGALGGGKNVYCAKWRIRWREKIFIVPSGALGGGKCVHFAKWRSS
jgi:hypothetical protein